MANRRSKSSKDTLRSRAEKVLSGQPKPISGNDTDVRKIIHELQVHQIELEMQNDELRREQEVTEEIRRRYVDLYDFAPVGYFTFDQKGKILEVNLTGATLLGVSRSRLIGRPFIGFVENAFKSLFSAHLLKVYSSKLDQTTELRIFQSDTKSLVYISLRSMAVRNDGEMKCRSAVSDITELKLAEKKRLEAYEELSKVNERLRFLSNRLLSVQEEERKRIALEVHDGFASSLSAIRYRIQDIPSEVRKKHNLENISKQLEVAIAEARRIQTVLRPPVLDDLGIGPALNWLCREFQKNYPLIGITKKFYFQEPEIPGSIKVAIFRITQEALNNIGWHSKADSVDLYLRKRTTSVDLVIQDNGKGFDSESILPKGNPEIGLGLSGMKERAALSGGSLDIQSGVGKGTIIRASWPTNTRGGGWIQ